MAMKTHLRFSRTPTQSLKVECPEGLHQKERVDYIILAHLQSRKAAWDVLALGIRMSEPSIHNFTIVRHRLQALSNEKKIRRIPESGEEEYELIRG